MENEHLKHFSPDPAETAAARWDRWLKRLENFVQAKGITDEDRKKAMLLHFAGEEVFELSDSLGVQDGTTFENTKTLLTAYFAPQRNAEYEVFMFRQAAQGVGETIDKFHARL